MTHIAEVQPAWTTIEELCQREFGALPSAATLAVLQPLANERAEVREFVDRFFRLMAIARLAPTEFPLTIAGALGVIIPGLLPGAWGGVIPPWTSEDRHFLIDDYLVHNPWQRLGPGTVFLEMGCGFPPTTAVDAARNLPDWRVIGADVQFDPFVLHDAEDSYACLDRSGHVRFFHSTEMNYRTFVELYQNPASTFQRFHDLFESLNERFPTPDDGVCAAVEHDGAKLIRNPIRSYERDNLTLIQAGIGADLGQVDVVRCFNVLFYFDAAFRAQAEAWALRTVRPEGLFICGADMARTSEARYTVYQNAAGTLVPREFAFSIDNIRPFTVIPWFSLHERDRETWALAELVGTLRSDESFRSDFDISIDRLLAEQRLLVRDADGFITVPAEPLPPSDWAPAREAVIAGLDHEGFVDRAVSVLNDAGYNAWRNPVGHVAIDPAPLFKA